jgi:hypothetical protein
MADEEKKSESSQVEIYEANLGQLFKLHYSWENSFSLPCIIN